MKKVALYLITFVLVFVNVYIELSTTTNQGTVFDGYKVTHYSIEDVDDNSDIHWIKIPTADVDLPVVGSDDDYYLKHNLDGEKSVYGTLYYRNDYPNVIYGHNMKDGNMFGKLALVEKGDKVVVTKGSKKLKYKVTKIRFCDDSYIPNQKWYKKSKLYLSTCYGEGRLVVICSLQS